MWGWKTWLAAGLVMAAASSANADEGVAVFKEEKLSYFGLTTNVFAVDTDVASADLDLGLNPASQVEQSPGGLGVRLGGMLDRTWGIEARLAGGLWHEVDRQTRFPVRGKLQMDVDHVAGVYATGKWRYQLPFIDRPPLVEHFFLQARAGMAHAQVKASGALCTGLVCAENSERRDSGGFSWGAGFGVRLEIPNLMDRLRPLRHVGLTLDYTDYGDVAGVDLSAAEASVLFFF